MENTVSFLLSSQNDPVVRALLHLHDDPVQGWVSPLRAPFGGIQADARCSEKELLFLMDCAVKFVLKQRGEIIKIKAAPAFYDIQAHEKLSGCYTKSGFQVVADHTNHFISVSEIPFEKIVAPSERRRLRKCRDADFESMTEVLPDVDFVHNFLTTSRNCLGYTLSMNRDQLHDLMTAFPDQVRVFTVKHNTDVIALALTIQVNQNVVYNFLAADVFSYRKYSPMVMLTGAIYSHCQQKKIGIIDLGTSLDNQGNEKVSLMRFKKNIGGMEDRKVVYRKILNN